MISELNGKIPNVDPSAFVAKQSVVVGDVTIGKESSIWFYTVARGDVHYITIGDRTDVQDNCVLHVTTDTNPLVLGNDVTVGHRVILHGCTV